MTPQGQAGDPALRVEVHSDEQGLRKPSDYLTADHVWPVVAPGLNTPPDKPLPCYQLDATLSSPGAGHTSCKTSNFVSEMVMFVDL